MIKKKILIVAPYPITIPQHGGQKRTKALVEHYQTLFEHVRFVGVFHRGHYPQFGVEDMPVAQPDIIKKLTTDQHHASELITGEAINNDVHVRSPMAKLLTEFRPDVIHIEQPYPFIGLAPLLNELNMHPQLIYGSQNIEHRMKKAIYKNIGMSGASAKKLAKKIEDLESTFSKQADLVIAVSPADAQVHKQMGARRVIIAPNGIAKSVAKEQEIQYWQEFKKEKKINQVVAFIGSGHPPNWQGYIQMMGADSSFLPKDVNVLMAGGVSEYFRATYKGNNFAKFWSKAVPLGFLTEEKLVGLLEVSDVILLPIVSGGGSNLKSAEAILSGKKIVATSYAFRGFDRYRNLENIYISDNPDEFRQLIVNALRLPNHARSVEQTALAEQVQWGYCLQPITPAVKRVIRSGYKRRLIAGLMATKRRARSTAARIVHKSRVRSS
jgi:hypothetical protein